MKQEFQYYIKLQLFDDQMKYSINYYAVEAAAL